MIIGVTGLIGHGKTYRAVRTAVEIARLRRAVLASNIRVSVPGIEFVQLPISEDGLDVPFLMDLVDKVRADGRGLVVLVDEVGIIMPARWWQRFPIRFLFLLSQSRKFRTDLVWTAQATDQVDKVLRDLTEYTDRVRAIPAPTLRRREAGRRPLVFRWTRWVGTKVDPTGGRLDECIDKGWELYRRETEGFYDTDEIVGPPDRLVTASDEATRRAVKRASRPTGNRENRGDRRSRTDAASVGGAAGLPAADPLRVAGSPGTAEGEGAGGAEALPETVGAATGPQDRAPTGVHSI